MSEFEHKALYTVPEEVDADWQARRDLAAVLRRVSERCVLTEVGEENLSKAKALMEEALELLPTGSTASQAFVNGSYAKDPRVFVDRGAMMGRSNPIAPHMNIQLDGEEVQCSLMLGERYVGAPGMAHGGIIAACFDQVSGVCAVHNQYLGFTASLEIEYIRPVFLHRNISFRAKVSQRADRHVVIEAECHECHELLAKSKGVFVRVDPEAGAKIFSGG